MARAGATLVLIVLAFLVASAASSGPMCCNDYSQWGKLNETTGCQPEQSGGCNAWCQGKSCRGGECKLRGGEDKCHCYC